MLIYILHSDKIYTFRLPKEVSGNYVLTDIDDEGHVRNLTNIQEKDGKWIINSNEEVSVFVGSDAVQSTFVDEYMFYNLNYLNKENILLYVVPGDDPNYCFYTVQEETKLILGSDNKCDLILTSPNISQQQLELTYNSNVWQLNNLNTDVPIYVNKKRNNNCFLYSFDNIFVMGVRIVILANKLIFFPGKTTINCYNSKVVSENKCQYAINNISSNENVKDFYEKKDYFSKSTVFRKKEKTYSFNFVAPGTKEKKETEGLIFQMVPTVLMSITSVVSTYYSIQGYKSGRSDKESLVTSLVMCVVMLFTGIIWPVVESFVNKIRSFITEKVRVVTYKRYLKRKEKKLIEYVTEQRTVLEFNNLSLNECQDAILKKTAYLFSRNSSSNFFLNVKLGVGKIKSNVDFKYERPELIIDNDKLLDKIDALIDKYKYIDDAPFTINLKNNSIAFINNNGDYDMFLGSILLQLITLHDYSDLKLVVLTDEFSGLNKIKNLNHCWSNDRSLRFFASNSREAENLSSELCKIYDSNKEKISNNVMTSYFLIVSDAIDKYKNLSIIEKVMLGNHNANFSLIMFSDKMIEIPMGCKKFISYTNNEASYFESEMEEDGTLKFIPQFLDSTIDYDRCIYTLSNIPIKISSNSSGTLPDKLGFLEMYNVGNLDQLNIVNRWNTSDIINSLAAPVGVDPNGNTLYLDLHEKFHGPHGLVAGMTGSGKSEFIITYILSLAVNYNPDEVQFVLIDYKGGGLAGAFENRKTGIKLPHLVGTITNLDKSEMNRTLVSIKSELQRRQRKFNEAKEELNTGSIDIYKYQQLVREGTLKDPMSHLFIICDEFAELKEQQPDFMDELVSAARIGRSLGIHLILATQKPSGVVNDQIWSNSKFKVCCKVQTAEDSNEMIMRPDAASIKESGRFYLLVGYDQYFVLGQSGYSGVQYVPTSKAMSKLDNSISFINNMGSVYKSAVQKNDVDNTKVKYGEELNNILNYIVKIANENNYKYNQLWLDNVPNLIYYSDIVQKYKFTPSKSVIEAIIGEYDDPENQKQGFVTMSLSDVGNTFIVGSSGMGKCTLMSTMLYSTIINYNVNEVNVYVIDLGAEKLRKFSGAPQVGEVIGINDKRKVNYLFWLVSSEIDRRKEFYSKNGGDFSYDMKNGTRHFPNILVFIYGMEVFREEFSDCYDELFESTTRSCSKYGINFIVSSVETGALTVSVSNNFPQNIALNMNDSSEYSYIFSTKKIPSKNPGRGLVLVNEQCMEFQTALIFSESDEKKNLDFVIGKLNEVMKVKAPEIPTVPRRLSIKYIEKDITTLDNVPIGINTTTAQIGYYNFSNIVNLMSGSEEKQVSKFFNHFIDILAKCQNNNVIVLNASEISISHTENIKYYDSSFTKIVPILLNNVQKFNQNANEKLFTIVIIGYSNLSRYLNEQKSNNNEVKLIDDLILETKNNSFKYIIYDSFRDILNLLDGNLSNIIDNQNGIWIGQNFDSQEFFETSYFRNSGDVAADNAVVIKDSEAELLKTPTIS